MRTLSGMVAKPMPLVEDRTVGFRAFRSRDYFHLAFLPAGAICTLYQKSGQQNPQIFSSPPFK
jgi:hypothetical protein